MHVHFNCEASTVAFVPFAAKLYVSDRTSCIHVHHGTLVNSSV